MAADKNVPSGWIENFEQAKALAKKSGRPILTNFTGSDWCGWCIRLKGEVFDTQEFKEWASSNVILLELDYPRSKTQTAEVKAQNQTLKQTYAISGYPTVLILDADGKQIGETGYKAGGPKVWIQDFVDQYKAATKTK
jgi:protein disulfide-isomerase